MLNIFAYVSLFFAYSFVQAATIPPSNIEKNVELKISLLLTENLKINTTLNVVNENSDDVRIVSIFKASQKDKTPQIVVFINVKNMGVNKSGKVVSQIISIFSIADIKIKTQDRLKLLEWSNTWNSNFFPVSTQIIDNKIVASTNITTTQSNPVDEKNVVSSFLGTVQIWPSILKSLDSKKLLKK